MTSKILFHGNFESSDDWNFVGNEWKVFSLWDFLNVNQFRCWNDFSQALAKQLAQDFGRLGHVAGYSLGGRVLLGLLGAGFQAPQLSFISTHPGLKSEEEKIQRLWDDLQWKERVARADWQQLFIDWNSQEVFNDDPCDPQAFARLEKYREEISTAFDLLSLGRMQNYAETKSLLRTAGVASKIRWICGSEDLKFSGLGRALSDEMPIEYVSLDNVSHRIHKTEPFRLLELLNEQV